MSDKGIICAAWVLVMGAWLIAESFLPPETQERLKGTEALPLVVMVIATFFGIVKP